MCLKTSSREICWALLVLCLSYAQFRRKKVSWAKLLLLRQSSSSNRLRKRAIERCVYFFLVRIAFSLVLMAVLLSAKAIRQNCKLLHFKRIRRNRNIKLGNVYSFVAHPT